MNCIFAAHIEYRNISIQKNCQPVQNPFILYYPHAYPPPILSHPMHTLPLFCPTPCISPPILSHPMHTLPLFCPTACMPSPYSIPPHACLPPILSHPMHTFPLFYPSICTPSSYSIPAYTHPPPILFHPIHALPLFYPTVCMSSPVLYHTCHPSILFQLMHALLTPCHMTWKACFSFDI